MARVYMDPRHTCADTRTFEDPSSVLPSDNRVIIKPHHAIVQNCGAFRRVQPQSSATTCLLALVPCGHKCQSVHRQAPGCEKIVLGYVLVPDRPTLVSA